MCHCCEEEPSEAAAGRARDRVTRGEGCLSWLRFLRFGRPEAVCWAPRLRFLCLDCFLSSSGWRGSVVLAAGRSPDSSTKNSAFVSDSSHGRSAVAWNRNREVSEAGKREASTAAAPNLCHEQLQQETVVVPHQVPPTPRLGLYRSRHSPGRLSCAPHDRHDHVPAGLLQCAAPVHCRTIERANRTNSSSSKRAPPV